VQPRITEAIFKRDRFALDVVAAETAGGVLVVTCRADSGSDTWWAGVAAVDQTLGACSWV